jgi:hypothetical protein
MRRISACVPLLVQLAALGTAVPAALAQAPASPPDASVDSAQHALVEMLSTATFGMLSANQQGSKVTKDGDGFRIELPMPAYKEPPDATVTMHATQQLDGSWNIASLTIPPKGEIKRMTPAAGTFRYSLGQQAFTAHVFADLSKPSTFDVNLKDVRLDNDTGPQHAHQIWEAYTAKGILSSDGDGRVSMGSTGEVTNWNMIAETEHNQTIAVLARRLTGDVSVHGLDRDKGERLRKDLQGLIATAPAAAAVATDEAPHPEKPPMSPAMQQMAHDMLHAMLDDATGLLRSVKVDETIEGMTVNADGKGATIGSVVLAMDGSSEADHLNMGLDVAANDMALPAVPIAYAPYVPKHVSFSNKLRGVPAEPLRALLRAALADNPDTEALKQQAIAVLATPGAVLSIDPFSFDAGPLNVTGTARLVPLANGSFGGHVHLTATGLDALMAQMQGDPQVSQAMPMLFIAKGMARPNGQSLVWDIDYDQAGVRINGTPFGGGGKPPRR